MKKIDILNVNLYLIYYQIKMESYSDYYCHKITDEEKDTLTDTSVFFVGSYVFIHNYHTFKTTIGFIDLSMAVNCTVVFPMVYFSYKSKYGKKYNFLPRYGKLYRVIYKPDNFMPSYGEVTFRKETINKNDKLILYSKIPKWKNKFVQLIFYIKELCKDDLSTGLPEGLPNDVIKYIYQLIKIDI